MKNNLAKIKKKVILIIMILIISSLSIGMSGINTFKKEIPGITQDSKNKDTIKEEIQTVETEYPKTPEDWEINQVQKYIDIKDELKVNKVLDITQTTPLDEVRASIIVKYSEELDVPVSLILSVIDIESEFDQFSVGAAQDRGYCQIIPSAEKWLTSNYGKKIGIEYNPSRIFEPEYNIGLGVLYIHLLSKAYDNDFHRVLSEYNRGPYNLKKYFNTHKTYQTSYSRLVLNNQEKYMDLQT